jgi:DNA-binding helix-hairpin-helix protein with protein kinase domain
MNDHRIYATGWYSVSPSFAWWNHNVHRMAEIKARREAKRVTEEAKQKENINSAKIAEGTISIYA